MNILALTILVLGGVLLAGGLMVRLMASLPLSVLERAQQHGRFAGLGSPESVVKPGKLSSNRPAAARSRLLSAA